MSMRDRSNRYGAVSRFLHWAMTAIIAWQFTTVLARILIKDSALDNFLWSTHKASGLLIIVLALLRLLWAFSNTGRRPQPVNVVSRVGHAALYALMIAVPALALLRQYGSGRAFEVLGVRVFAGFDTGKITWMTDLGSLLHSNLGWLLFVAIVGHVAMVIWHQIKTPEQNVLPRMWR